MSYSAETSLITQTMVLLSHALGGALLFPISCETYLLTMVHGQSFLKDDFS